MASMLKNTSVYRLMKPVLEQKEKAEEYVSLALKNQGQVQSDELTQLLEKSIRYLLKSKKEQEQHLALDAVGKFNIGSLHSAILPLIKKDSDEGTLRLIMLALNDRPSQNKLIFSKMAKNETLGLNLRANAIKTLAVSSQKEAKGILRKWLPKQQETEQRAITKIVSNSKEGSILLKELFKSNLITSNAFDISSAERIVQSDKEDVLGKQLLEEVHTYIEQQKKAFTSKLEKYMEIAEKGGGNPREGEKLFQVCLMCHAVGSKGQNVAPALDGSALRENEGPVDGYFGSRCCNGE